MSPHQAPAPPLASDDRAVLALNCGSSTVKFAVFCGDQPAPILHGNAEALETEAATFRWTVGPETKARSMPGAGHREAIEALVGWIADADLSLGGIGHRVVHGGEFFAAPARVDADVLQRIEQLCALAPLHNPANLLGIRLMSERFPALPQLAVFDTAFHQTLPPKAYHYALPVEFYKQHRVRRYGFHGTSHQWVAQEAALRLRRPLAELQLLVVHLGNGCSACAIRDGRSVDTTMGLTPMEGMMMGTRSGDVDPSLHQFLATQTGRSLEEITHLLNRQSGLFGVSGVSNDRRVLEERMRAGDARATLALEMFSYRAAKATLALTAALTRIDALVFTGGIGENSPFIRRRIIEQMALLGIDLDSAANEANGMETDGVISRPGSPTCLVLPTNEELAIAREVRRMIAANAP